MNRNGAYELSNAIVLQAVKDYRAALSGQKVDGKMPNDGIKEIEKFFRSEYGEEKNERKNIIHL